MGQRNAKDGRIKTTDVRFPSVKTTTMRGVIVMRVLGGLLLVAAGLKLYGLAVEPVGRAGIFSEPWVQTLIVEWEIVLGIWLIVGMAPAVAWLAATSTFVAFAGFSFWQGWEGQTSCGCFGAIRVHPWASFGIDVVALALLGLSRRQTLPAPMDQSRRLPFRQVALAASGVLAVLAVLAGIGTMIFGSPDAALAHLRGDRVTVFPRLVDVGTGALGDTKEVVIAVRNWTDRPIRLVGGTSDCSCVVTADLPTTIAPNATHQLRVSVALKGPPGQFTRLARLYTDDAQAPDFHFRLTGRSLEAKQE